MNRSHWIQVAVLLALGGLAAFSGIAAAQEHPEHPMNDVPKAELTLEQLAQSIDEYVTKDTALKGGYFLVYDQVAKKPLVLTLDHVHKDRLSALGDEVYFACADFKAQDGKLIDVDVFMKNGDSGLVPTEVHIHKVDGKPRYTWKQDGDIWVREDVK